MKAVLFLLILLPMGVFAGRSYTIKFTVIDDVTEEPMEGVLITCGSPQSLSFETNENGTVSYFDCKEEWLEVTIRAEKYYEQILYIYSRKAKVDQKETIRMIPTDRPNISVAKLAEMEEIKNSYNAIWEEEMQKRLEKIATIDTNLVKPCSFESDDLEESEEELYFNPEFPGGAASLQRYIMRTLEYPEHSIDYGEQGKVYVKFTIEKDGAITNIEIERGVSPTLDTEAMRIFQGMPKWLPGSCNGRYFKTTVRIPIIFSLN